MPLKPTSKSRRRQKRLTSTRQHLREVRRLEPADGRWNAALRSGLRKSDRQYKGDPDDLWWAGFVVLDIGGHRSVLVIRVSPVYVTLPDFVPRPVVVRWLSVADVRIVKAIKAKTNIPVIVLAVRRDARKAVLDAGASLFLDIPAQAQQLTDAVAECLGFAPRMIAP